VVDQLEHVDTMRPRPPMPGFNIQAMTVNDRKALHAYLKAMGPAGRHRPRCRRQAAPPPYAQFPG